MQSELLRLTSHPSPGGLILCWWWAATFCSPLGSELKSSCWQITVCQTPETASLAPPLNLPQKTKEHYLYLVCKRRRGHMAGRSPSFHSGKLQCLFLIPLLSTVWLAHISHQTYTFSFGIITLFLRRWDRPYQAAGVLRFRPDRKWEIPVSRMEKKQLSVKVKQQIYWSFHPPNFSKRLLTQHTYSLIKWNYYRKMKHKLKRARSEIYGTVSASIHPSSVFVL